MEMTSLEEYAIRCALCLAKLDGKESISSSVVAKNEGISVEYARKIMHLFKKSGLVQAERGHQGGFKLSSAPESISLLRVMNSVKEDRITAEKFCSHFSGKSDVCVHDCDCALRPVWKLLSQFYHEVLNATSLYDLLKKEVDSKKFISELALKKANDLFVLSEKTQGITNA